MSQHTEMNAKGLSTNELLRDKRNYGLYFFNIYGSGLQIIKEQFKYEVNTGLRQNVFIIDLHDIEEQGKNLLDLKKFIAQQIQECRRKYDFVMRKIQEEMKFDLHQYWLKSENTSRKPIAGKTKLDKSIKKTSIFKSRQSQETKITCNKSVVRREHNQVGRPEQLSWRKYIKDEPTIGKLYIIILGQVTEQFYKDLLRDNQPIEGILNLLPQESKYDIKLGNNEMRNFIMDTIQYINTSVYQMRQMKTLKPVGIFFHSLPVISTCLATKYSANIFDQLTWITYDVETLRKQYELYYYKPFQMTDVEMPEDVDIKQLYHVAETLSLQGHFLTSSSPKYGSNFGTIAFYLNSLLNACGLPDIVWKNYKLQSIHPAHSVVLSIFKNSFANVTKFDKFERLIVDDNNKLLLDMLQFTNIYRFRDIHNCCMDYNIFREYIFDPHKMECSNNGSIDLIKSFVLPKYIKYYANKDCNFQRIHQLMEEYDDYQIDIEPGYKLYTFKKIYNTLIEKDSLEIIPTRLCFRDFTLFQMEEFLFNLTPKPNAEDLDSSQKGVGILEINENIFIRRNSLKASKLQMAPSHGSLKKTASKNTFEKRSSQTTSTVTEEENFGLPPNHRLLKGYNLEDILQEIKFKTSKFNYRYGFVQLYEQRWCFQDMNKQLKLDFNDTSIIFNTPHHQDACLDKSVYLVTKNNIGIRILNEPREYNKIILNYPNGLSIYYQNYHNCEQKWISDECSSKEQRRIYTPYGCIIVYFKSNDMILIMRYNGEIYQLLQYELEAEEEQSLNTEVLTSFQDQSSGIIDIKAQGDVTFSNKRSSKDTNQTRMSSHKIKRSRKSAAMDPLSLKSIIQDELRYLEFLIDAYELNYLHLIVTNTQGKRVTINRKGKISAGPACKIKEWRDYFVNEDYCQRSDGVKMIWTKDCFKCYHKDGTLFTTRTEEGYATAETDEFDSLISQSSSHNGQEENADEQQQVQRLSGGMQKRYKNETISFKPSFSLKKFITNEGNEEHETEDAGYISYSCCSFLMENNSYAGVDIFSSELSLSAKPTKVELFCLDNIRAYIVAEPSVGHNANIFTDWETDILTESEEQNDLAVNIWIGENLNVSAYEYTCKIYMQKNQLNADESQNESNSLTLSLIYSKSIYDAFKYLVNEIASFNDFCEWKMKELYFIEKVNSDSTARGFEFLTALPPTAQYICQRNNVLTELKPVITMDKLMSNNYDWHQNDLKKFPRFKELKKWGEAAPKREIDFPYVLSSNVFIEIPTSLRSIGNITKFLESFEGINFKKHRNRIRSVLKFYLKPIYDETLRNYTSTQHWKKRRWEHRRRLFVEQQRLGLYYAMLKYKKFPNYWKFITEYKGEVRWIEFFDFVQNKCASKKRKLINNNL